MNFEFYGGPTTQETELPTTIALLVRPSTRLNKMQIAPERNY